MLNAAPPVPIERVDVPLRGPHTSAELKKKHGIDYDCHASYRFAER